VRSLVLLAAATLAAVAALGVQPASGSPRMLVGLFDEGATFFDNPATTFPSFKALRVQILRVSLYWGGKLGVARRRPAKAVDSADPAYDWSLYDRTVEDAAQVGIRILFTIYGTPRWANGGGSLNRAPRSANDLRQFAYAAATRYGGRFQTTDGRVLPAVRLWTAWNEPNNPVYLRPQFKRVGRTWVIQSAKDYAKICAAVYTGVHDTRLSSEKVACGVTAPRGNNNPRSSRPSIAPITFLTALKNAGLKRFDAYAHHPYYANPSETPATRPGTANGADPTAVTLGNFDVLVKALTRLYGPRRIWITEYGYQTNPPDSIFGVSWARQASYLKQAFAIARKNPRVDMMLWFLLKDDPLLGGWQSGLLTASGRKKPAFTAFQRLPHG
jgi:hypothetical protein